MKRIRVLIADDERELYVMMSEVLKALLPDADVYHASSVQEAMLEISVRNFDMVISDCQFKDKFVGGPCVISYAKDRGAFTVMCSGSGVSGHQIMGANRGALDRALPKPFEMSDLADVVRVFKLEKIA